MVVEIFVIFLLMVVGVCGNVLVFIVVWKEKLLRIIFNVFVVNFVVIDFLFFIIVLLVMIVIFICGEWILGMSVCKL